MPEIIKTIFDIFLGILKMIFEFLGIINRIFNDLIISKLFKIR